MYIYLHRLKYLSKHCFEISTIRIYLVDSVSLHEHGDGTGRDNGQARGVYKPRVGLRACAGLWSVLRYLYVRRSCCLHAIGSTSKSSCCSYWMLLSKLLPVLDQLVVQPRDPSASGLLSAMETDTYYCYLVPLTIPITMVACYANWVSLKFFRHN